MTVLEKEGKIYHDEHDITIKVSNDNTKHLKIVSVTLRSDGDPTEAMKLADKLYKDALGT